MNKITEEQLSKIQGQQKELNGILHEVGVLEAQKHGLLHQFAGVNKEVEELKSELENEYGAININVEDGTYTEIEKEVEEPVTENV
jgi:predicted  nucleic acid-binding Zn-ribbon protein